jgi:hypothetical protein
MSPNNERNLATSLLAISKSFSVFPPYLFYDVSSTKEYQAKELQAQSSYGQQKSKKEG